MKRTSILLSFLFLSLVAKAQWAVAECDSVGIHKVTGQWLIQHQVMAAGDSVQRLVIGGRASGPMREVNETNVSPAQLPYYIDDQDQLLDAGTVYYFYSGTVHGWTYEANGRFNYTPNEYAKRHYVRFSKASENQEVLPKEPLVAASAQWPVVSYTQAGAVRDPSKVNLVKTGRRWFGDAFGFTKSRTYVFDLSAQGAVFVKANAVARSKFATSFTVTVNGQSISGGFQPVGSSSYANYVTESNVQGAFALNGLFDKLIIFLSSYVIITL